MSDYTIQACVLLRKRSSVKRYKSLSDEAASKPAGVAEVITDPLASTVSNLAGGNEVITDLTDATLPADGNPNSTVSHPARTRGRSTCGEHHVFIAEEHAKGRNATAIYQELVEHHGYAGSDQAVRRFVRTIAPADPPYAKCRFETAPGQEAQVDYGARARRRSIRTPANIASRACSS